MAERASLRLNRPELARLTVALLLSLAVHLGVWGGYAAGKKLGWWAHFHVPAWMQKAKKKTPPPLPIAQMQMVDPTVFVDVSHADSEPPPRAKYYSDKNSRAANPDTGDANQPKLKGRQKDVPKTEDVPQLPKLQPSAPPPQPRVESATAIQDAPPGETKRAETNQVAVAHKSANPPQPERPRTIKQALAQRSQSLPGQQFQQDGGVKRQLQWSSLDAKSTAFGAYDRAIIEAVTQRWYDLLDSRRFAQDRTGKVILQFKLKADGSVTEMHALENTVGELLGYVCQSAVEEAAPFAKWPADMQRMIGTNFREITFTFYYY